MKKTWVSVIAVAGLLLMPGAVRAHKGHDHKVIGTISGIQGKNLMVKTTDGKTTMVMLDANTRVTRGKAAVDATELKIGDRVVATGPEEKEMVTAKTVEIGAAPAAKAPTKTSGAKPTERPEVSRAR